MTEKLKMKTADMASENFEKLKALFPNCVTESLDKDGNPVRAIDKDLLMQEINSEVVEGQKERYQFNWPGKRDAIRSHGAAALRAGRGSGRTHRAAPALLAEVSAAPEAAVRYSQSG